MTKMNLVLTTNPHNWSALVARLALGLVLFPHGAQKLLGWFGGYGFSGTMNFLTSQAHLPAALAFMVIIVESFGALALIFGFCTRIAAFAIICHFIGVVYTSHINNGFFMNWYKVQGKGEGLEYFFLLFGLAIIALIAGGGKASVDAAISRHKNIDPAIPREKKTAVSL